MKIKFSKRQKKGMLVSFLVVGVTGAFIYSKFNNTNVAASSPEQTSVSNKGQASQVANNNPDVESLIDNSSPLAKSAREAEKVEEERRKSQGESYIGDVFLTEKSDNSIINIPNFDKKEEEKKVDLKPIKVPKKKEKKEIIERPQPSPSNDANINIETILNSGPAQNIALEQVIPIQENSGRLAGSLTTFAVANNDESENEQIIGNKNSISNRETNDFGNNALNMYEKSSPSYQMRNNSSVEKTLKVTLGSKFYATIGFAINSDDGGPALATIHDGPLKGAKLQGDYTLNELAEAVNISFNEMSFEGETYSINAIAFDLNNDRPVLADSVNHRRLQKYGGMFLSSFIAGYADTLRDTTTNVTEGGNVITEGSSIDDTSDRIAYALSEPAKVFANEFRKNIDRPITVYISKGSGAGIYFLDDIEVEI